MYKELCLYSEGATDLSRPSVRIGETLYVDRFRILEVVMPTSYLSTDASNNTISFTRSAANKTASVPPANYTSATFPAALQAAMNAVSTIADWSVTYDSGTNSLSITNGAGTSFTVNSFLNGTTMYSQLGMAKNASNATGTTVTFGSPDFSNWSPLLLSSSSLITNDCIYASPVHMNVIGVLPMATQQNSLFHWMNPSERGWFSGGYEISEVDFFLLNAKTLRPITILQPFLIKIAILTDIEDEAGGFGL